MKRCSLYMFLSLAAILAVLSACGDGEIIDVSSGSPEYAQIMGPQGSLGNLVSDGAFIDDCANNAQYELCQQLKEPPQVIPSSSSEPEHQPSSSSSVPQQPSSSSQTATTPSSSSQTTTPSSSSRTTTPSSSSVAGQPGTIACAVPSTGTAGSSITPPEVTCSGTIVNPFNLTWTNAPVWSNPVAGSYSNVSVTVSSANQGACSGQTASCTGSLTVIGVPSSSSVVPSSSSTGGGSGPSNLNGTEVPFPVGTYEVTLETTVAPSFRCYISPGQDGSRTIGTYTPSGGAAVNIVIGSYQTQTDAITSTSTKVTFNITTPGITCKMTY